MKRILCATLLACLTSRAADALPAVPGAFGFGMASRAAYACGSSPAILRVQNLNDGGSSSLRAAMEASGPRVVIFETSGTIVLDSDINVNNPCLTVAGQTAPSPGITLRGATSTTFSAGGINVFSSDVLIQHLRVRPGDGGPVDFSQHYGAAVYYAGAHDVIFDHLSVSWAGEKNFLVYNGANPTNVTFWRCINSEALYRARNVANQSYEGTGIPSSLGMLVNAVPNGGGTVSVIGNLFAHSSDRVPEIGEGSVLNWINNVAYDWATDPNYAPWAASFMYSADFANPLPWLANFIGNLYIAGRFPAGGPLAAIGTWSGWPGSAIYTSDNIRDQTLNAVNDYFTNMGDVRAGSPVVSVSGYTILPSSSVKAFVLANAGARPADRDAVDIRIVSDVTNHTGGRITSQNEVGGWPTLAVNSRALTTPGSPHTVTGSGYTNLEVWLHGYADAVEGAAPPGPSIPATPTGLKMLP